MAINKYRPHVLLLPEDEANNEIVNGFLLDTRLDLRVIQALEVAGGWTHVRDRFQSDHINAMVRFPHRTMVLLVDFDEREDRMSEMTKVIPPELTDRVFVIGVKTEPEELKKTKFSSLEVVGKGLAQDCAEDTNVFWSHDLLVHNFAELTRLRAKVQPFLFPVG